MTKISTTIRELPHGWLWKERGTLFKTAKSVITALKKEDRQAIASGKNVVIRLTSWETTSTAGKKIVGFLTSK